MKPAKRMKIVTLIARILLGLIFVIFGLNGFLHFLAMPLPAGLAGTFLGLLISSHYIFLVAGVQLIAGVLLLINRFVPLALALLAAMLANILTYHATMDPKGFPLAIFVLILWGILVPRYRSFFEPLFVRTAQVSESGDSITPTYRSRV